jgi:predicted alpha/beta-fold hydrolase
MKIEVVPGDGSNRGSNRESHKLEKARALLTRARQLFANKSFKPHSLFTGGHAQTIAAYAWPRRFRFASERDEERLFEVAAGVKVLAHCRWQADAKASPTIVAWHGIEGSTGSNYMQATAEKGFRAGFNVIRVNFRNCGGTEHLTSTIYHGGLSADLAAVVKELLEKDRVSRMLLVGFSLGGNLVLKLAGEFGDNPPAEILGVCAVSPSVDLTASADMILKRSNWIYHRDFVRRLKQRIRTNHKLYPEVYDISGLRDVRTLREFDDRFTSRAHGFADANDYYYRSSSLRVIDRIRIPTLVIHAEDDPFIPFAPLRDPAVANNPYILLLAPRQGGHVAFISARTSITSAKPSVERNPAVADAVNNEADRDSSLITHDSSLPGEDRFWAENRVIEFCRLATHAL